MRHPPCGGTAAFTALGVREMVEMERIPKAFWSTEPAELLRRLRTTRDGLTSDEAADRLEQFGPNLLRRRERVSTLSLLLAQFRSPIILLLLIAAVLSIFLGEATDAVIIIAIIGVSGLLGFWQERGANRAVEKLLAMVRVTTTALRDGAEKEVAVEETVPGDVVLLNAGAVVPGDCRILESKDLFVNEAALTGETYPIEKGPGSLPAETPLAKRTNSLFLGTHVVSGEARAVVVRTGAGTEFGGISKHLGARPPETEFETGVRQFGYFLLVVTIILVAAIFVINVVLDRPILDSFLFSLALAVGLTPQLLPAIISINLAHGARRMAAQEVIVKRLASIENFGSMNVLCCDKTGTLTEGVLQVHAALDVEGNESERVLFDAYLNAALETGFVNPFDQAIRAHRQFDISGYRKLDEIPYDFNRKRLSILVAHEGESLMVTKGSIYGVFDACTTAELGSGRIVDLAEVRPAIEERADALGDEGFRVLGVAYRRLGGQKRIEKSDEAGMTLLGLIAVFDPPKPEVKGAIERLGALGVTLKVISGDSAAVARHVAQVVGLRNPDVLTGTEVRKIDDEALAERIAEIEVLAEIEPDQKERIIVALKKAGQVVGYIGDGINDAPAIRAADVGLSVDQAVDVAKAAADIVLLRKDLGTLADGVREGRRTFANTMKYVFMATSANFGNMFSMAGASLFLPFLPLLPGQILLTNLLTDFPEMTIATDSVDAEIIEKPRRWDIKFIRRFMSRFGLLSSVFDYLTFGALILLLNATVDLFRTGWFVESVVSASTIVLVIRSRRPLFKSRPGRLLTIATLAVIATAVILPYTPIAEPIGFRPMPGIFLAMLAGIVALYVAGAELVKRRFYRNTAFGGGVPSPGPPA